MINFPRWQVWLVIVLCAASVLFAAPTFMPQAWRTEIDKWMTAPVLNLGLDLQGGSYLLLQIDMDGVVRDKLDQLRSDVRRALAEDPRITSRASPDGPTTLAVTLTDDMAGRMDEAETRIRSLQTGGGVLGGATQNFEVVRGEGSSFRLTFTEAYISELRTQTLGQSIEIVRRRIDELGTREPTIQAQGEDRIIVQVPGLQDPQQLKNILGQTAKLSFRFLNETVTNPLPADAPNPDPAGSTVMIETGPNGEQLRMVVYNDIIVAGDNLIDAQQSFDQRSNAPIVTFRFDSTGARKFGDATQQNVGRRFAIVLDDKVVSAPVINEPIIGGSGQISGNFTVQSALELALVLRAGALPAKLVVEEERTVGAELGEDSIRAGSIAAIVGFVLVMLLMIASYGRFGIYACIALVFNLTLIVAIMSLVGSTLTLPGIAGIVLTIGMAVDANVLIFERMREEAANGKQIVSSIDSGYNRAMSAIVDSNLTTLLACLILFWLGSGPVRGFAVTLSIGITVSMFTAIMVTRLMVVNWLRRSRPKALPI
jgi:protein-export membrane protein SecD